MKQFIPRIEISLSQIRDNACMLSELYGKKGISLMGVSKAVLGEPSIAEAMIKVESNLLPTHALKTFKK